MHKKDQVYMVMDYETRSTADIGAVGGFEYARHPSTQLLCVAYRIGTRETLKTVKTQSWSPAIPAPYGDFKRALKDPNVILVAHNVYFESVITHFVLKKLIYGLPEIPVERWICTAAMARSSGLPGKLENVAIALDLAHKKDMQGHRLMLKMAKPRRPSQNNPAIWHNTKEDLERLIQYCVADIDAEVELFLRLFRVSEVTNNPKERTIWEYDQRKNLSGVYTDQNLVNAALEIIEIENHYLKNQTRIITNGKIESTNQIAKALKWVNDRGANMTSLDKKSVEDALKILPPGPARELIEIRQLASKSSTAKFQVFKGSAGRDSVLRDHTIYYGAVTGRDSAQGVQVHNMPRPTVKITEQEISDIKNKEIEYMRMMYGSPLTVLSSAIRGVITPRPGYTLYSGDFSSIEVRVLFWLANNERGLQGYRENKDIYVDMASVIFRKPSSQIGKDSFDRFVGKQVVLGAGYGAGFKKFMIMCEGFGQPVKESVAKHAIDTYRKYYATVPKMWKNLEAAAIAAVRSPGKSFKINKTRWFLDGDFLRCELPSGRRLAYYKPEVRSEKGFYGMVPKLYLWHWDIYKKGTNKWVQYGTWGGHLVENVTQATARDVMKDRSFELISAGYDSLFEVHDEIIMEKVNGDLNEFKRIMSKTPEFTPDLPIGVEAWCGERYRK